MTVTDQIKEKVVNVLFMDMKERNITSQAEYSRFIKNLLDVPFDKAALSSIKKREKRNVIKDSTWLKLAQHFNLLGDNSWQTAPTFVFEIMQTYLHTCKKYGMFRALCDHASFGKTYAANEFMKKYRGAVFYVDCSNYGTKTDFILELARQLGLERSGTYNQLWSEIVNELLLLDKPQLILDEFGDVHDSIITLLKSLYNKADMGDHLAISIFHIGADNMEKRMIKGRKNKKQSYAEYWSRIGDELLTLNLASKPDLLNEQLKKEAEKIIDLNLPECLSEYRNEIISKAVSKRNLRIIREQINVKRDLINL